MKPIEGAWLAIKRNLITQAAYLVTFNNQQAIQRQLGTHHSYFPHPVRPADPCVLNQPRVPPTKRKANTNYINYWFSKKWDTLPFRCPSSLLQLPFPADPQSSVHPLGTSSLLIQRAYLTNSMETSQEHRRHLIRTWHHRHTPTAAC